MECLICYEEKLDNDVFILKCCNSSKQICRSCLQFLKEPICPYCRKSLENNLLQYMKPLCYHTTHRRILSWEEYIIKECVVNPYTYDNSKRLRRHLKRLRYEYNLYLMENEIIE